MKLFETFYLEEFVDEIDAYFKNTYALIVSSTLVFFMVDYQINVNSTFFWVIITFASIIALFSLFSIFRKISPMVIFLGRDLFSAIPVLINKLTLSLVNQSINIFRVNSHLSDKGEKYHNIVENDSMTDINELVIEHQIKEDFDLPMFCFDDVSSCSMSNSINISGKSEKKLQYNKISETLYFLEFINLFNPGFKLKDKSYGTNVSRSSFYKIIDKKSIYRKSSFRNSLREIKEVDGDVYVKIKKKLTTISTDNEISSIEKQVGDLISLLIQEKYIRTNKLKKESIEILSSVIYQHYLGREKVVVSNPRNLELIESIKSYFDKI